MATLRQRAEDPAPYEYRQMRHRAHDRHRAHPARAGDVQSQVRSAEASLRGGQCGLEQSSIPKSVEATVLLELVLVDLEHFIDGEELGIHDLASRFSVFP